MDVNFVSKWPDMADHHPIDEVADVVVVVMEEEGTEVVVEIGGGLTGQDQEVGVDQDQEVVQKLPEVLAEADQDLGHK